LYFDGSAVELTAGSEDINGLWIDEAETTLFFVTRGNYRVGNLRGDTDDLLACAVLRLGRESACAFSTQFDGDAAGFRQALDGVSILNDAATQLFATAVAAAASTTAPITVLEAELLLDEPTAPEDVTDSELDQYDDLVVETDEWSDLTDAPTADLTDEVLSEQLFLPLIMR
jgi:hypothetical protein